MVHTAQFVAFVADLRLHLLDLLQPRAHLSLELQQSWLLGEVVLGQGAVAGRRRLVVSAQRLDLSPIQRSIIADCDITARTNSI